MKEIFRNRILPFLLSVVTALSLFPGAAAFAEEGPKTVITRFEDLEKLEFDSITQGTKEEELLLPKELKAYGHHADEEETQEEEFQVPVKKWQVKLWTDEDETKSEEDLLAEIEKDKKDYSEDLELGTYLFLPDFDDSYELAEGVKLPSYKLDLVSAEPETEADTEALTELVTEPVTEPATELVTEPATEPITEQVTEPATESVTEAVTEPVTEAATEAATEPATETVTEAVTEPVTELATEAFTEPAAPAEGEQFEVQTETSANWNGNTAPFQTETQPETAETVQTETAAQESEVIQSQTSAQNGMTVQPETTAASEKETESETKTETEPETVPTTEPTLEGELRLELSNKVLVGNTYQVTAYFNDQQLNSGVSFSVSSDNGCVSIDKSGLLTVTGEGKFKVTAEYQGYTGTATTKAVCEHERVAATCTEKAYCKICGKKFGEPLGHKWAEATCTEPKTCERCGKTEGKALGHEWTEATCTAPKTCSRCGETEGEALGHSYGEWTITVQPTISSKGERQRSCTRCGDTQTEVLERLNIVGNASDNTISGISSSVTYGIRKNITLEAGGAGMSNLDPIQGDVRFVPTSWVIGKTENSFGSQAPYSVTFQMANAGTFTLRVNFQKQTYSDGAWQSSGEYDVKEMQFTVAEGGTGGETNGANGTAGDSTSTTVVKTGDNTQILPFLLLLAVSAVVICIVAVTMAGKKKKNRDK